jgi:hypothetical protein
MPNGGDRNFIRLCAAVDGFMARHGRWPTQLVVDQVIIDELRNYVLAPGEFERMQRKLRVVRGNDTFRAEDDSGHSYDYRTEGFPDRRPSPSAAEWLGVELQPDLGW